MRVPTNTHREELQPKCEATVTAKLLLTFKKADCASELL